MEVLVRCVECNAHMEEHKMEKEFTMDAVVFVSPTCDCYEGES